MYVGSDDSVNVDDEIEVDTFDSDVKFACSFRIIRCLVYTLSPFERSGSIMGCLRYPSNKLRRLMCVHNVELPSLTSSLVDAILFYRINYMLWCS